MSLRIAAAGVIATLALLTGVIQPAQAQVEGFSIETIGGYGYGVAGASTPVIQVATQFLYYPQQTITLDASGLPAGATWYFDPHRVPAGESTWLNVYTPPGTPSGFYTVTVYGIGETTVTTQFSFIV